MRAPEAASAPPMTSDGSTSDVPTVKLSRKGAERLAGGHPWVYRSDIDAPKSLGPGVVRLVDGRGWFVGTALYGQRSTIAIRLLTREDEAIDRAFWKRRLERAIALRETLFPGEGAVRLVHAEADLLPGLVVDRYADCLVMQTPIEATDALRGTFAELLVELVKPRAIVERNDMKVRAHEGLPSRREVVYGSLVDPNVEFVEGGVRMTADLVEGQKTGAFLDQRENRIAAGLYARGRALDCFAYNGAFALQLAKKAEHVTAIEISDKAAETIRANARLNGAANVEVVCANVFDFLHAKAEGGTRYDTIVLDPPAFAKKREDLTPALRGYKEVNLRALQLLAPGGVLITASCSFHVSEAAFEEVLHAAAKDAGRSVQVVERRRAGRDHPTLLGMPESGYLKCYVLRVPD